MKTGNRPGISIVQLCYNPLPGWCGTLERCIHELNAKLSGITIQYIVSKDGSTTLDLSEVAALDQIPNVVFLNNIFNEGKGSAIRKGALLATADIIVYTDIDFPFGTDPIVEMVSKFGKNPQCWFAYGNRTGEFGTTDHGNSLWADHGLLGCIDHSIILVYRWL